MCRYVYPPRRIPEDLGHVHNDAKQSSAHGDFVAEYLSSFQGSSGLRRSSRSVSWILDMQPSLLQN